MQLDRFRNEDFDRGRSAWIEALWMMAQWLLVSSWLPGSAHRVWLLRCFGAKIGHGMVVMPRVRIKFPWRLRAGDHVWLGEAVWIDNLDIVEIGDHCCVSQGSYLCTGNHDWSSPGFDLVTKPIVLHDHVWIGAGAVVSPGSELYEGAVVALGSTVSGTLESWKIYQGNPAVVVRERRRQHYPTDNT